MRSPRSGFAVLALLSAAILSAAMLSACGSTSPAPPDSPADQLVRPAEPLPSRGVHAANEIRSLRLTEESFGALLVVVASAPLSWESWRDTDGNLVVELPDTSPGPGVADLDPTGELVAEVRVEAPRPRTTRIVVVTRSDTLSSLTPRGNLLRIELAPTVARQHRAEVDARPAEVQPVSAAPEPVPTIPEPVPAASEPAAQAPEPVPAAPEPAAVAPEPAPQADEKSPDPSPASPVLRSADTGAPTGQSIYELQLGLFAVPENATGFVADLKSRGYEAYIVEVTASSGEIRHTVRLGPYPTRSDASRAAKEYREREGETPVIRWRPAPSS